MSTLRRQEPTGPGLKRIACEAVELAIRSLTRQAGQVDAALQGIEQCSAVLTLIEPAMPRQAVRRDRAILARLVDGLTELSEPAHLAQTLTSSHKSATDPALASAVKALRKRWSAASPINAAMTSKAGSFNPAIYRLVADMAELRGHCGGWAVEALPNDQVPSGLRRTYTKARKLAHEPITPESLVVLTTHCTELSLQLTIISKACPAMLKAQRKLIARATDTLQQQLRIEAVEQAMRGELGKPANKALPAVASLAERVNAAMKDVNTALSETPAAFMKRLQAYWSAWRGDSK